MYNDKYDPRKDDLDGYMTLRRTICRDSEDIIEVLHAKNVSELQTIREKTFLAITISKLRGFSNLNAHLLLRHVDELLSKYKAEEELISNHI